MNFIELDFEIQLFTKKLRSITCDSNDLDKKCLKQLKRLSSLIESIKSTANVIEFESNENNELVNVYNIDEFGCELKQNIYCSACQVN